MIIECMLFDFRLTIPPLKLVGFPELFLIIEHELFFIRI